MGITLADVQGWQPEQIDEVSQAAAQRARTSGEAAETLRNLSVFGTWKGEAGDAILYPSTTIHQVAPVTRGVRLVGITWIQSWVADAHERELLLQLDEARSLELASRKDPRMTVLLESLRTNLFRKWSDT